MKKFSFSNHQYNDLRLDSRFIRVANYHPVKIDSVIILLTYVDFFMWISFSSIIQPLQDSNSAAHILILHIYQHSIPTSSNVILFQSSSSWSLKHQNNRDPALPGVPQTTTIQPSSTVYRQTFRESRPINRIPWCLSPTVSTTRSHVLPESADGKKCVLGWPSSTLNSRKKGRQWKKKGRTNRRCHTAWRTSSLRLFAGEKCFFIKLLDQRMTVTSWSSGAHGGCTVERVLELVGGTEG